MLKIKDKLKHFFDYKKRFKNQKHKNKRLKKKINKITISLMSELKLDVTNEENAQLKEQISKAIERLNSKQIRFINEKDYILTDDDLDEIMQIFKINKED